MGLTQLKRPTLQALRDDTFNRFIAEFGAECAQATPNNNIYILSQILAGLRDEDWGWRDSIADQIIPDLASGVYLKRWASILGCDQRPATYAKGNVVVTGVPGSVIPAGTSFTFCDGSEYLADVGGTIPAAILPAVKGSLTMALTAVKVGPTGNRSTTDTLFLSSTITGVDVQAKVPTGIVGGADIESEDSLRICVRNKFRRGCTPGSVSQIEAWIQECNQAVTFRCIVPNFCGCGVVAVFFLMETTYEDTFGTPLPQDIIDMQTCLDKLKVAGTTIMVKQLAQVKCNVTIEGLTPDTPAIRAQIVANIEDVIIRRRSCATAPCKAWFYEAMSQTPDVVCGEITGDCSGAVFTTCMIPAPGTVTFI